MIKPWLTPRLMNVYGFFSATILFAIALYFQYVVGLQPCPLCVVQRMIVGLLGVTFLFGAFSAKQLVLRVHSVLAFLISTLGMLVSLHHVRLQHLPASQVPSCGPALSYMLKHLPIKDTLRLLYVGTEDCASVSWQFLSLSMAEWLLIIFIGYMAFTMVNFYRAGQR